MADASGARVPAYIHRWQAWAVIVATASTYDRVLFESRRPTGSRVTEILRLR